MAKRTHTTQVKSKSTKPFNPNAIAILVVALVLAVGGIVFAVSSGNDSASTEVNNTNSDTLAILNSDLSVESTSADADTPVRALISPNEYTADFAESAPHVLIDVREDWEFAEGHIGGANNVSVSVLANNLDRIPQDVPVVVYCRSGNRSAQAAQILAANGFTQVYDLGGVLDWQAAGLDLVR